MKQYVLNKSLTQTKAIRKKCEDCIYDPLGGGSILDQITACTANDCSLWEWRPLNKVNRDLLKQEKLANMTPEELEKYKTKADIARKRFNKTFKGQ